MSVSISEIDVFIDETVFPTDTQGAIPMKGLQGNTLIAIINSMIIEYGYSTIRLLDKIRVIAYDYRTVNDVTPLYLEDIRKILNVMNALILEDNLHTDGISFSDLADYQTYRSEEEAFVIRGLHFQIVAQTFNDLLTLRSEDIDRDSDILLNEDGSSLLNEDGEVLLNEQ